MYGLNGDIAQDHIDMHMTNEYRIDNYNTKRKQVKTNTMKTSKVKNVCGSGTWDSPNGTFFKFEYQMEDGQIVNAMHKTAEGFFKVGDTVDYEITNAQYNNGKVRKPEQQFQGSTKNNGGNSDAILYQVCLKGSIDFHLTQESILFTSDNINAFALELATKAKSNIQKLSEL